MTSFLGKIRYSRYLNHTMAILVLTPVYRWVYAHSGNLTVSFLVCVAITFAVVFPVPYLTYRIIEEPGILLGKKAANWIKARQERGRAAAQAG